MKVFDTVVSRFFPVAFADSEQSEGFDLWRLPNDPDSPHVGAVRDLFLETFKMPPERFDACVEPRAGIHRRLIVAARRHIICGGILHTVSRLIRLDPRHTDFFEAAGYQRTEGCSYGDMHKDLDLSTEARSAAQDALDRLLTLS